MSVAPSPPPSASEIIAASYVRMPIYDEMICPAVSRGYSLTIGFGSPPESASK